MSKDTSTRPNAAIPARLKEGIVSRLRKNKGLRRTMPVWGRIHIDRQVPFICVYRRQKADEVLDIHNLVTSEAAYLYVDAVKSVQTSLRELLNEIADVLVEQFGSFLILEIWPASFAARDENDLQAGRRPRFRIVTHPDRPLGSGSEKFVEALSRVKLDGRTAEVEIVSRKRVAPPDLQPLMSRDQAEQRKCVLLGLEIAPVFADLETGEIFPQTRRKLERQLTLALKRFFYEFAQGHTTHRPAHYHSLGRRATVKAVWKVDARLAEVAAGFDFLLNISPINTTSAFRAFQKSKFRKTPVFHYRLLPVDPLLLKRQLFETPIERVEDPAIGDLLRDKMMELDRQLTMLMQINTPHFMHSSMQLYGGVEDSLLETAERILKRFPKGKKKGKSDTVDAHTFAARAREEIDYLRGQDENVSATVEVRDDVNGLMVSHGSLLVGSDSSIPTGRVEALVAHEVGTHVLTFYNGRSQPFRQLSAGLSGYESLQEGIAVFSEYLVGGLDVNRLRLLAARVIAVRMLTQGSTFIDCFERISQEYHFTPVRAFSLVMRVFRGGGLTKDAIYLRGLAQLLLYLGKGGDLKPLFIGKISVNHISIIKELLWREVLSKPKLTPRFLLDPAASQKLELAAQGIDVLDLVESPGRSSKSKKKRSAESNGSSA